MTTHIRKLLAAIRAQLTRNLRDDKPRSRQRGVTLVEMMVVIVIIGLVAGIVGVQVFGRLQEAQRQTAYVQIKEISQALDLYKLAFRRYPSTGEGLQALASPKGNHQPFMQNIPKDPWDGEYIYIFPGTQNTGSFDLISYGPDEVQGGPDDINNWESPNASKDQ